MQLEEQFKTKVTCLKFLNIVLVFGALLDESRLDFTEHGWDEVSLEEDKANSTPIDEWGRCGFFCLAQG